MDPSEGSIPLISVFRIREFFYARILTLIQVTLLCGVTIGVLDPNWIFILPSGRRHRFSTHASPTFFYLALGSVNFLWILKAFFFPDPHLLFMRIRSLFNNQNIDLLLTLLPCVIARDQGGGGGRRRQRRRRRGLRGGGGGGGGGRHPRGRRGRGGSGRGRVRGEVRLDSKVWTPLSSPGTPLLLG